METTQLADNNKISTPSTALVLPSSAELMRNATDISGLCRQAVLNAAIELKGNKYVKVEGWQTIAAIHGCAASSREVEKIEGGVRAIGELRRLADGQVLATSEGFVSEDEAVWFGGEVYDKRLGGVKTLPPRPYAAIRAMAQTRAISRVCRGAFAHVVLLMDAGLQTTPAEEMRVFGRHLGSGSQAGCARFAAGY